MHIGGQAAALPCLCSDKNGTPVRSTRRQHFESTGRLLRVQQSNELTRPSAARRGNIALGDVTAIECAKRSYELVKERDRLASKFQVIHIVL